MKSINAVCSTLYELVFLLFFVLILMAPFHSLATRHLDVVQTLDETHAVLRGNVEGITAGMIIPLYRFNRSWERPIGTARVESVADPLVQVTIDPSQMSWPLGITSTISRTVGGRYTTDIGSDRGIERGASLTIFRDRIQMGQATVVTVGAHTSELILPGVIKDPSGLVVSTYAVATQAAVFEDNGISILETVLIALIVLGYVVVRIRSKRSPFISAGELLQSIPINRRILRFVINILVGIPFTWFMTKMPLYVGAYLGQIVYLRLTGQILYLSPIADMLVPFGYVAIAIAYYAYLLRYHRSPMLALWHFLSYKGTSKVKNVSFARGLFTWMLHLVIVYFFASTLIGFLAGDIAAARAAGAPFSSMQTFFEVSKYVIWALTVVGCLMGYGYSVVSILWGRYIRNLDFTVTGWLTNAFCYPLLGVVIWQITPSFTGVDPIVTTGALELVALVLGFAFNLLYMLSIWNLGTKFDLMADKGVRTSGFYSVVRHPNYALEAPMFLVTELVGLSSGVQWLAMAMVLFLYWIRSEREDNFMGYSNPDYLQYRNQTPYKFIPGIY